MFDRNSLVADIVRWTARVLSVFSTFVLMQFLFGEPFNFEKVTPTQWLGLALFPVGLIIGFAVAWWREALGGSITIGSLLAFYVVFTTLMHQSLSNGGWFFVFGIPGFLF
ncbi:MAG TPA: hypothetical protein VF251_11460, partial [Pyrinomonadaceae bacterium]